jgi:hypothetical protein
MKKSTIFAERLRRQCLTHPLETIENYIDLFRRLQPVSPVAYTRPGDPPRLIPRTSFDDGAEADRLRAQRRLVKARFFGGNIGYVLAEDLALYANVFQKPMPGFTEIQEIVLDAVQSAGPLTPRQLKEETGLLNKQIMPALHRLQKAFLVYEDQTDDDWERGWYDFASEWPDVKLDETRRQAATGQVLLRFLEGHVFATFEQLRDWSQLPAKVLKQTLQDLEQTGLIVPQTVEGLSEGWLRSEDVELPDGQIEPSEFMLHKADILVRSHASELKRRFGKYETLQYLLIDGEFRGAVVGHWRIGPHDVDDIVLTLPADECTARRGKIIDVVSQWYHPPHNRILKYMGEELGG